MEKTDALLGIRTQDRRKTPAVNLAHLDELKRASLPITTLEALAWKVTSTKIRNVLFSSFYTVDNNDSNADT